MGKWKSRAWDVYVFDTFAESHISNTSTLSVEAVNKAAANKIAKYSNLATTHIFVPFAIETEGAYNLAMELIDEIGKHTSAVTKESLETSTSSNVYSWPSNGELQFHSFVPSNHARI